MGARIWHCELSPHRRVNPPYLASQKDHTRNPKVLLELSADPEDGGLGCTPSVPQSSATTILL